MAIENTEHDSVFSTAMNGQRTGHVCSPTAKEY